MQVVGANTIRISQDRIGINKFDGKKRKVFYGQEHPNGESTTTESGVNYQQLAVITEAV